MRHFAYVGVLLGCLVAAVWLEPLLRVNVFRRWRRLVLTLLPVVVVFVGWDLAAIAAGHWSFDQAQITGLFLPGGLPIDEVLFFVVVPICAILGFEAVRAVLQRPVGDESPIRPDGQPSIRPDSGPSIGPTDEVPVVGSGDDR